MRRSMAWYRTLAACALLAAAGRVQATDEFSSFAGEATGYEQAPIALDRLTMAGTQERSLVR